ncbi:transposase [Necropsobacter rosorum]|uniref:transposase n=1 Tax=Necropsobacter rosorum TaxID=908285 RepID=UPI000509B6CF
MLPNRKLIRVKWDNYQNGAYFITICTKNKQHYFGKIYNQKMYLSVLGEKLHSIILDTIEIRQSQYINLPIFTIMPNHLHFIMVLNTSKDISQHSFQPQRENLASIIRGIKCQLTSFAKQNNIPFEWQSRYYDRIIRNDREFGFIYDYIDHNVINWEQDKLYS